MKTSVLLIEGAKKIASSIKEVISDVREEMREPSKVCFYEDAGREIVSIINQSRRDEPGVADRFHEFVKHIKFSPAFEGYVYLKEPQNDPDVISDEELESVDPKLKEKIKRMMRRNAGDKI